MPRRWCLHGTAGNLRLPVSKSTTPRIDDLQAVKDIGEESLTVWRHLRVFWPALDKLQTFNISGKELENILPLSPTAHRLWQTNKLGFRPIPHPHDSNSLYLQVVWFQNYHNDIGWSKPVCLPDDKNLRDTRREVVDPATQLSGCQFIRHGDVYEFKTTNPTNRPLPNLRFLQLRYAVQKLFAGVQAAGATLEKSSGGEEEPPNVTNSEPSVGEEEPPNVTNPEPSGGEEEPPNVINSDTDFGTWPRQGPSPLECIFSMGVPELPEGPEPPDESYMPRDWDWMLDEAWKREVLDESSEAWWRKCTLKQAYLDWCKGMATRQALADEMGPDGGEEEE